ncbi:MAG TPA: NAD(P)-binding domain-containing protein [Acidimicrobiales bacterium]|nr:NAD(P)-binding domain-containing protein [Acidimicrobiales bacterium]
MRTTVIGLGSMGTAAAGRLLDRGHDVTVWNRSPGKADALARRGATVAADPAAAVADAEVVLVVLTDDDAVASVLLGDGGAAAALAPSAVLADVSTVSPALARRLADEGPAGRVLDSPVLGAPAALAAGKGRFLVGGPEAALATAQPVLDDLGAATTHCGPAGAGAVMKLVANLMLVAGVAAMAEGVAIARGHGLGDDLLRQLLPDLPVTAPASAMRLDPVLDPAHPGWFGPALARKDVRLAAALAGDAGLDPAVAPALDRLLGATMEAGEWPDFSAVIEGLRRR